MVSRSCDLQTIIGDAVSYDQVKMFQKLLTRRVVVRLQILHMWVKTLE